MKIKLLLLIFFVILNAKNTWHIGISSNSLLPTVNGSLNYVKEIPETEVDTPGTFVERFDVGNSKINYIKNKVAVANGNGWAAW